MNVFAHQRGKKPGDSVVCLLFNVQEATERTFFRTTTLILDRSDLKEAFIKSVDYHGYSSIFIILKHLLLSHPVVTVSQVMDGAINVK